MKRDDLTKILRVVARIDNTDAGNPATDDEILQYIADVAAENDRLENEVAEGKRRYADAFLNGTGNPREERPDEEPREYKMEDYLNL